MLYIVKFEDGATYATGPQGELPGGPIAFESEQMAQEMAGVIDGGYVESRTEEEAIKRCLEIKAVLYIRRRNGGTAFVPESVPSTGGVVSIPVSEAEGRQRLIEIANRHQVGR